VVAAKAASTKIPVVFGTGGDPVRDGFVASLNRPGGNITGVSFILAELGAKQLGLLHELQPGAEPIGVLVDPRSPISELADAYRQVGVYTGRILNGEKPADLPIIQSNRIEFVINLNTAEAFGLTFPPTLLAIADEVIE
jgi:ABC-type uncharacterized transport system substrate-binding protein